jgi:hypothetical protein
MRVIAKDILKSFCQVRLTLGPAENLPGSSPAFAAGRFFLKGSGPEGEAAGLDSLPLIQAHPGGERSPAPSALRKSFLSSSDHKPHLVLRPGAPKPAGLAGA